MKASRLLLLVVLRFYVTSLSDAGNQLTIDVDDQYILFIDGAQAPDEPNMNNCGLFDTVPLPNTFSVLAVQGYNVLGQAAIIAYDTNGLIQTSTAWKCSSDEVVGWQAVDFDDSSWPNAFISPWSCCGISSTDQPIWTQIIANYSYAYCRTRIAPISQLPEFSGPFYKPPVPLSGFIDFYFNCLVYIEHTVDPGTTFTVALTFDGVANATVDINSTSPITEVVFTASQLEGNVGKLVSCNVQVIWNWSGQYVTTVLASQNSYWVGIKYATDPSDVYNPATQRIEFDENVPSVTIYFFSTVNSQKLTASFNGTSSSTYQTACAIAIAPMAFQNDTGYNNFTIKAVSTPGVGPRTGLLSFLPIPILKNHAFWEGYQIADIPVYIIDDIPGRFCVSEGDPHFKTFDSSVLWYDWTDEYTSLSLGDFLLMKSNAPRYFEVHVRQQPCPTYVACNCAVAVREGNNILGVYACGTNFPPTPIQYLQDSNFLGAEITISPDGSTFNISMPSGAYVTVETWVMATIYYGMHVFVYPISEDRNQASGLCGNYNGDPDDDLIPAGQTTPDTNKQLVWGNLVAVPNTFIASYSLTPNQSLINAHYYPPVCVNSTAPFTCGCTRNSQGAQPVNCTPPASNPVFQTIYTNVCINSPGRRKRAVALVQTDDNVIYPGDYPLKIVVPTINQSRSFNWPTPSGITAALAESLCRGPLVSLAIYPLCQNYVNITSIVNACVFDLGFYDNRNATAGVIERFQQSCIFQIKASENTSDPNSTAALQQLLQNVQNQVCPGQCTGHGTCNMSQCSCNKGYLGSDCSIVAGVPPVLTGFRKGPLCDIRQSPCVQTFMYATRFYSSPNLTCRAQSLNLDFSYKRKLLDTLLSKAAMVSRGEIQCSLPTLTPLSPLSISPEYVWNMAISNDGLIYSNVLRLTVYDSLCLDCSNEGHYDRGCNLKRNTCLIDGSCYGSGDRNPTAPCLQCNPSMTTNDWSHDYNSGWCSTRSVTTTKTTRPMTTTRKTTTTSRRTTTSKSTTTTKPTTTRTTSKRITTTTTKPTTTTSKRTTTTTTKPTTTTSKRTTTITTKPTTTTSKRTTPTTTATPCTTGKTCIRSCRGLGDGPRQSCHGCSIYAKCIAGVLSDGLLCGLGLVWDDHLGRCAQHSSTCTECQHNN